jgi:hypothetical protein
MLASTFDLISKEQAGFQTREEALSQAVVLLELLQRRKNLNLNTTVCFLDFRKAYDLVPHNLITAKLKSIGISGKILTFITNLYIGNQMNVKFNNAYSRFFEYKRGLRQGCPLSPILFNLFVNDIVKEVTKI